MDGNIVLLVRTYWICSPSPSKTRKPLRICISPHVLQRPKYWEQQKLRPRGAEEDMLFNPVSPYSPYLQAAISRRRFLKALQCSNHWSMDWNQRWNMLTGSIYSCSARALANRLCLETASIHIQHHAEVSFGLSIFYYATFFFYADKVWEYSCMADGCLDYSSIFFV